MRLATPEFRPDPSLSREAMEELQRKLAERAVFTDEFDFDPAAVAVDGPVETEAEPEQADSPIVVGVDQAFLDERAVSAIIAIQDGAVVERAHAVTPLDIPYIPGLLAFREGTPILAAFEELTVEPDLAVFDGSGRIHFRQAGIATHIGVMLDLPSVGVAKSLLCGTPDAPTEGRAEGWSTPIRADNSVEAPEGTILGHAYQSRQWDRSQSINPLYVSPGHRVSAEATVGLVEALCAGYKLPEPTRLADGLADDLKAADR
ncbi:endonuclease V [Halolamina sp.]|uniref:endonuclease V n=1 Tax=Halolamina sp. TaxID=1940283 RepID=UPI00356AA053